MLSEKDGMVLVFVPAGEFEMGSNEYKDEQPIHTVYLDAYWIDQTEETNQMYADFLNEMGNRSEGGATWLDTEGGEIYQSGGEWVVESGKGEHPVIEVSWYGAAAYCEWADRRLPTEAEWEKAARGADGRTYPWGEGIDCEHAQYSGCGGNTIPVGSLPTGASPYGALDMAGNVWEWVADWYDDDCYDVSPASNPPGSHSGSYRVLRGGSWGSSGWFVRSAFRDRNNPGDSYVFYGFRCALSSAP